LSGWRPGNAVLVWGWVLSKENLIAKSVFEKGQSFQKLYDYGIQKDVYVMKCKTGSSKGDVEPKPFYLTEGNLKVEV